MGKEKQIRRNSSTLLIDGVLYVEEQEAREVQIINKQYYDSDEDEGIHQVTETTETGDAMRELNKDEFDKKTRMSGIDLRSRLHHTEISGIVAVDSMVALKTLPQSTSVITLSKKRNAVSDGGEGRKEIVAISQGLAQRETDKGGGSFFSKLGGLFASKKE